MGYSKSQKWICFGTYKTSTTINKTKERVLRQQKNLKIKIRKRLSKETRWREGLLWGARGVSCCVKNPEKHVWR